MAVGDGEDPESGLRRLEAESRETPTMATLEDGSPAELAPHRWWAEGEQRGCQTTAVEEAGKGGHLKASRLPGLTSGSRANTGGRSGGAGSGGCLWRHTQLTLSHGAGGGVPLRIHTIRGVLPQGRRRCRLTHLD